MLGSWNAKNCSISSLFGVLWIWSLKRHGLLLMTRIPTLRKLHWHLLVQRRSLVWVSNIDLQRAYWLEGGVRFKVGWHRTSNRQRASSSLVRLTFFMSLVCYVPCWGPYIVFLMCCLFRSCVIRHLGRALYLLVDSTNVEYMNMFAHFLKFILIWLWNLHASVTSVAFFHPSFLAMFPALRCSIVFLSLRHVSLWDERSSLFHVIRCTSAVNISTSSACNSHWESRWCVPLH